MERNIRPDPTSGMAGLVSVTDENSSATENQDVPSDLFSLEYMQDPKPGPLDAYRKTASFDWKAMRLFLDGEDIIRYKVW